MSKKLVQNYRASAISAVAFWFGHRDFTSGDRKTVVAFAADGLDGGGGDAIFFGEH